MKLIEREQVGHVAFLRFHRPEVYHALNRSMLEQLSNLLQDISKDNDVRVVLITGSGERAFCAGADLKERQTMTEVEVRAFLSLIRDTFLQVEQLPQPVIAAINGVALGGGLELALACDLRIAEEHVQFALPETSLGIIPGAGGTQRLTKIAGLSFAKELIYTARRFTAEEALQHGIVSRVTTKGQAFHVSMEVANQIADNAPLAVQQAKRSIDEGYGSPIMEALDCEAVAYDKLIPTRDRLEGLLAFREKRKPIYRGE